MDTCLDDPVRVAEAEAAIRRSADAARDLEALTRLTARVLRTPGAVVNLIDEHRQWQAAAFGMTPSEVPRHQSMCNHTVLGGVPVHVEDARLDRRFVDNPFVSGEIASVRMYAAAPLVTDSGNAIGTLCVIDDQPRTLSPGDLAALEDLARQVVIVFELRHERELLRRSEAQHRSLAERYASLARRDALTGLPNRRAFDEHVVRAIGSAKRRSTAIGVLYVDLDGFKSVNDSLGHAAGDEVLREVGARFAAAVRDVDTVARLGGDEFVVLCEDLSPDAAGEAALAHVAERIERAVEARFAVDATVGASVGRALYAGDDLEALTPEGLLAPADQAMYAGRLARRVGA